MKIKPSWWFLILIMVLSSVIIGWSVGEPSLNAKLMPIIVGGIVLILAAIQLVKEVRGSKPRELAETEPEQLEIEPQVER